MGVDASHHDASHANRPYGQTEYTSKTKVPKGHQVPVSHARRLETITQEENLLGTSNLGLSDKPLNSNSDNPTDNNIGKTLVTDPKTTQLEKQRNGYKTEMTVSKPVKIVTNRAEEETHSCVSPTYMSITDCEQFKLINQNADTYTKDGIFPTDMSAMEYPNVQSQSNVKESELAHSPNDRSDKLATFIKKVQVKASVEKSNCSITGMAILSLDQVILTDNKNHSVKIVDMKKNKIISRLKLTSDPWDVTVLPEEQVAVTMPHKKSIQVISTYKYDLSKVQTMQLNSACYGIDYYDGKLFVLCCTEPISLVILTLDGQVLKCVKTDSLGVPIFLTADHLTVTPDAVFISDRETCTISNISHEGEVIATFKDDVLNMPSSMTTTCDGHLLVCSWTSQTVLKLTKDFQRNTVVLSYTDDGVMWPQSVCFCRESNILYVGSHDLFCSEGHEHVNCIQLFKVKRL